MEDRVRDVWQDAQHHWRATAIDEQAAASGLTAPAAVLEAGAVILPQQATARDQRGVLVLSPDRTLVSPEGGLAPL